MRINDLFEGKNLGLTIFDIDDTLFRTTAQIKVVKDGKIIKSLNNQEFNTYKLQPGESFDFGEFRNAEKFNRESIPIEPMIAKLKAIINNAGDSKVIMLTARSDFDNKELFLDTFRKYGIDMNRVHVHRAGNLGMAPAESKAVWIRRYLDTGDYARIRLYDDAMSNIKMFINLQREYPGVKFFPYFVTHEGSIKTIREEVNINNKNSGSVSNTSSIIDNKNGWGAVPNNQEIDYLGLRVTMTPNHFIDLAAPLGSEPSDKIAQHLEQGGTIGSPFLQIEIPESWEDGDFTMPARVMGHEGRNRMAAVATVLGNNPVETHLFFNKGLRNRHITDEFKKNLNRGLVKEKSKSIIRGPFFSLSESIKEDGRIVKGVNTTADVGPNEIKTQAAKFGNTVDKDGRPPTMSKAVKGSSTNVLYNLGLAERYTPMEIACIEGGHCLEDLKELRPSVPKKPGRLFASLTEGYKLQLERDKNMLVLHIKDNATGKRTEVRGKPGYETDGYNAKDPLHKLLDVVGKSANISELMNGEVVTINPKHPDAARALAATDRAYNEAFDTDVEWIKGAAPQGASVFAAKVDDAYIEITYKPVSKGVYISFTRGARMSVTGEGSQNKIFGAVINHIKKWVDANKPQEIYFSAFKPRTGAFGSQDTTRSGLYRKMVQRFASQNGYDYDVEDTGNEDTFILTKKQQPTQTNEALDQPYSYSWVKKTDELWQARARTDSGANLIITFEYGSWAAEYSIEFTLDDGYKATAAGDQFRIFATVVKVIQEWWKSISSEGVPVQFIMFSADKLNDKTGKTGSREKLYNRFAQQFATSIGFIVQRNDAGNATDYELINPNYNKRKVSEAFDTDVDWVLDMNARNQQVYATKVDDAYIELTYKRLLYGDVYIEFTRGGRLGVTGEGNQNKIFGAVINHMKQWVAKNNPPKIMFSALKMFGDTSRSSLYKRMVQRFASQNGYDYDVEDTKNEDTFILTKKQQPTQTNEALDQPYPVRWSVKKDNKWYGHAKEDDFYNQMGIEIKSISGGRWTIRFKVGDKMDKTGEGDEFKIFATVKAAIQEWWAWASKNAEVNVITFSAEKIVDSSRSRLYNRFAQQFARTIGYDMEVVTGRATDIFYLKKPGLEENFADGKEIGIHRSSEDFAVIDLSKSADGTFWLNGIDNTDWDSTVTTGQGVDMAFEISPQAKLASYDDIDKYSIGELENMGYDGVRMKDSDNVAYQIWNTKILKRTKLGENFADGKKKGKSKPGRVKKSGASCNGSVTALRKRAKNSSGEKAKMYHWCANMKSGKKK